MSDRYLSPFERSRVFFHSSERAELGSLRQGQVFSGVFLAEVFASCGQLIFAPEMELETSPRKNRENPRFGLLDPIDSV